MLGSLVGLLTDSLVANIFVPLISGIKVKQMGPYFVYMKEFIYVHEEREMTTFLLSKDFR